ncbi:MAG: hypothetical protein BZY88_05675 [SAR202 cluster bacterium Io17-Chloro-G9]|nr:MAG: hypothetical protein BZY88_05675 [SAR202 cluster bacterium Io17-Chloro-G9]
MRTSRLPEGRGISKPVMFSMLTVTAVIVAGLIVFFAGAFDSTLAEDEGTSAQASATQITEPADVESISVTQAKEPEAPAPTPMPTPMPTAEAAIQPVAVVQEEVVKVKVLPDAKFGEVLADGWVNLDLPAGASAETWYTLQVDTETQAITNFIALYNQDSDLISSVKIENYTKGEALDNAELTMYYSDGAERVLYFDGVEGTMTLTQAYPQPAGPSMFSSDLRVAMVFYGMELKDDTGRVNALLNLDLTGLSLGEVLVLKQPASRVVNDMLTEISDLIEQVETQRSN